MSTGDIRLFGGANYTNKNFAACDGSLLEIAGYEDLYALIGTTYGGDGTTTFALPNLTGRFAVHVGDGFTLAASGSAEFGISNSVTFTWLIALNSSATSAATIGEIRTFAFGFMPTGWVTCDGRMLNGAQGSQYAELYAYIGTTYGTDGSFKFAVPDLGATALGASGQSGSGTGGYVIMTYGICYSGEPPVWS